MMKTGDSQKVAGFRFGFTLIELLTVIVVIGILAAMLMPAFASFQARGDRAKCVNNLKSLYVAAGIHLEQQGSWPQIPYVGAGDKTYARAWINALSPYGISQITWVCPSIQRTIPGSDLSNPEFVRVDYVATPFNAERLSPTKHDHHPWFLERGSMHGDGNLAVFANGEIKSLGEVRRDALK